MTSVSFFLPSFLSSFLPFFLSLVPSLFLSLSLRVHTYWCPNVTHMSSAVTGWRGPAAISVQIISVAINNDLSLSLTLDIHADWSCPPPPTTCMTTIYAQTQGWYETLGQCQGSARGSAGSVPEPWPRIRADIDSDSLVGLQW